MAKFTNCVFVWRQQQYICCTSLSCIYFLSDITNKAGHLEQKILRKYNIIIFFSSRNIKTWKNGVPGKIVQSLENILWQEEGYTVKYGLSTREIPRAEPKGFLEGSGYISQYILTWVIIQTFSISKSYTSSMSFLVGQYWKSWFSVLVWQLGYIFLYCLVAKAIRVRIDPIENSVVAEPGNTHGQESNTRKVKFQYCPF